MDNHMHENGLHNEHAPQHTEDHPHNAYNQKDIDEMVQEMLKAMSAKGWRITDQRKSLSLLFAESPGYLAPKDVYDYMKRSYPGVSFDTVYRNLRLLSEMGVLEQIYLNDGLKFRARCQNHHHHHLICMRCEKTIPFEFCPMQMMPNLPQQFNVVNHRFDVLGYCQECAEAAKHNPKSTKASVEK